ncbi:DVUA0089 family protein [Halodurantibacterium flavum]|uniref:DVUA0089 family protein n=1 Tax=Halodurantibacterium flavum TaxID=1382802 RepID=A0ABW4S2J7_9RHOB
MGLIGLLVLAQPALAQVDTSGLTPVDAPEETSEEAENGFCGQPLALTDTAAAALQPGYETQTVPLIMQRGEPRYLDFSVTGDGTEVQIRTRAEADGDTILALYNAGGERIAFDDDSGGGLNSLVRMTLASGDYCAQVRLFGSQPPERTDVTLFVEPATGEVPADGGSTDYVDPGVTATGSAAMCTDPTDLGAMPENGLVQQGIAPAGGTEWFSLSVPADQTIRIDARSTSIDTVLTVRDSSGARHENDDYEGTDSRLVLESGTGEFCIGVNAYGGGEGPYQLAVAVVDEQMMLREAVQSGDMLPRDGDAVVEDLGTIEASARSSRLTGDRTLWTKFRVTEPGLIVVQATAMNESFDLRLYNADGRVLSQNWGDGMTGAQILNELVPGEYYIAQIAQAPSTAAKVRQVVVTRYLRAGQ